MHRVLAALLLLACLGAPSAVHAGQISDNNPANGLSVSMGLRHRVTIPQIMYFRVGSEKFGDVDKVEFNITPGGVGPGNNQTYSGASAVSPIGDGNPVTATSAGAGVLPVVIMANVGTLTLSYDLSDPLGLGNGSGDYIPFDEIGVTSSDPGLPTPPLANAGTGGAISVNIAGNQFGGRVVQRKALWTYTYLNTTSPVPGTYTGTVRYTLAAP